MKNPELDESAVFQPRYDADGLIAAIAVEKETGEVLMMAWMNAEALEATRTTGEVHYWSRSRKRLWKKGEDSGNIQKLHEIRVDCDQDALLLIVSQGGARKACHTGRKSCFYRRLSDGAALAFIE